MLSQLYYDSSTRILKHNRILPWCFKYTLKTFPGLAFANDTRLALGPHARKFRIPLSSSRNAHTYAVTSRATGTVVSTALSPGHSARIKRSFPPFDAEREGRDVAPRVVNCRNRRMPVTRNDRRAYRPWNVRLKDVQSEPWDPSANLRLRSELRRHLQTAEGRDQRLLIVSRGRDAVTDREAGTAPPEPFATTSVNCCAPDTRSARKQFATRARIDENESSTTNHERNVVRESPKNWEAVITFVTIESEWK